MNKPRGLAALSPERRREIAAMGGKSKVKKGMAVLKEKNPQRFKEISSRGGRNKERNYEQTV